MNIHETTDITKNVVVIAAAVIVLIVGVRSMTDKSIMQRVEAIERRADRDEKRLEDINAEKLEQRLSAIEAYIGAREIE